MFNFSYAALGAFALGLVATLVLAAWLTPARWWRRLNAGALAIVLLGTWGLGTLALWMMQSGTVSAYGPNGYAAGAGSQRAASVAFRVHEDLNLRASKGTAAERIAIVPAGTLVTTTGERDGDWWEVRATFDGRTVQGWSSSLWLRRADEARL